MPGCLTPAHPMNSVALKTTGKLPRSAATPCSRAAEASGLRLEIIQDEVGFLALEPFWDRLLARSSTRTPFLRWDWVSLWWNVHRNEFDLAIGVVRDKFCAPVAIAPLVLGRGTGHRRMLRHLTFIGGIGNIISEGMDFIIPCGMEELFAPLLAKVFAKLRGRWDLVFLPMLPVESPNRAFMTAALPSAGGIFGSVVKRTSRYIPLPKTWAELELQHSANWRSTHRRKWRKAMAEHSGRTLLAGRDLPFDVAFDALISLHRQRFDETQSRFLDHRVIEFHRELVSRWIPTGRAQLSLLEMDGKFTAATYCFVDDGKAWQYQSGWDPAFASLSIGRLGMGWAIQTAVESGLREFDFLPGEFEHKKLWTAEVHHLEDIECYATLSVRGWLFRAMRAVKRRIAPVKNTDSQRYVETQSNNKDT